MSELQKQIQEVEVSIEEARKTVAFGEAIRRLEANKDFQKVVHEGYYKEEASRLALFSASPAIDDKTRADALRSVQAIGEFHGYLRSQLMLAEQMEYAIEQSSETLDELRAEDAEGEV